MEPVNLEPAYPADENLQSVPVGAFTQYANPALFGVILINRSGLKKAYHPVTMIGDALLN